jgi:hypothetical protein
MTKNYDNIGEEIEATFPGAPWTGGSGIHRSVAVSYAVKAPFNRRVKIITALAHAKWGLQVWGLLQPWFSKLDWMVSPEEFTAIALSDVNRSLLGLEDTKGVGKLKNPMTGNVFNRMGTLGDIVAGPRFWANEINEQTLVSFRFRLNGQDEGKDKTKERIRARAEEAMTEVTDILQEFDIQEPTEQEYDDARVRVRVQ